MTLEEMEKRLRVLEDIEQIKQLQYRYLNCIMFAEWDEIMDCFAEDCTMIGLKGKAAIAKNFKDFIALGHHGAEGDFEVHPIISVDGDKATGNWITYFMYFYPRTRQSLFWVQGAYEMEYVRENGEWKISNLDWIERIGLPGGGPPRDLFGIKSSVSEEMDRKEEERKKQIK